MKTIKILTLGSVLISVFYLGTVFSETARASDLTVSKERIIIESGNSVTTPIDPTDPNTAIPTNPVDPTDPDNHGTGHKGALSIDFISNLKFGSQPTSKSVATYYAINEHPFVQVTDTRGTGAGWNLTASVSEFKSPDGHKVLKGAELSLLNGRPVKATTNVSTAPAISQSIHFENTQSQIVMQATKSTGTGTWDGMWQGTFGENHNVQLKVLPDSAEPGIFYTAMIHWQLADAPM